MPRHANFPTTTSHPSNLHVSTSPAEPKNRPATRLQATTNLPEPSTNDNIGQLAPLASPLDAACSWAAVREQQSPDFDTFYDPYTNEASYQAAGRGAPIRRKSVHGWLMERDDDGNVCYQFGRGRPLF
ncbi:hypothetical protein MTO96_023206 [Rhipicephalus appendiculatus]